MTEAAQVQTIADVNIPVYYEADDIDYLYDNDIVATFDRMHVSTFQSRKSVQVPQAIELAMQLPTGAFIAGWFVKEAIHGEAAKEYDVFFGGEQSLKNLVRRIHNAPEGSFLHGYESSKSLRDFSADFDKCIQFTHSTKPTLRLNRVRWFASPEQALDKFDITASMFALMNDLTMVFKSQHALADARSKYVRLNNALFPVSTGLRMQTLFDEGWVYWADTYDTYNRDTYLRRAKDWVAAQKALAKKLGIAEAVDNSFQP